MYNEQKSSLVIEVLLGSRKVNQIHQQQQEHHHTHIQIYSSNMAHNNNNNNNITRSMRKMYTYRGKLNASFRRIVNLHVSVFFGASVFF